MSHFLNLSKISFWLTAGFPVWSFLIAVLALFEPSFFLWYGSEAISWGLGFIMLGMGMTLSSKDFALAWKAPGVIGLGVSLQFLVMPAWSAFLAWMLPLSSELAVGLILVACCPGGTASNVVVFLAKAKVALSVSLTLCSTLAAIFLTPWLTYLYAGQYVPIDPWALLKSIILIVLFPLLVGITWNRWFPKSARGVSSFSPAISVAFILLIVGFILASKRTVIFEYGWLLLVATSLLHLGGFLVGYLIAYLLGRERLESQTLSIEVGMQNSGLGAALATKHFPAMPLVPAPCAMSAILHCLIGSVLASRWSQINSSLSSQRM